MTIEQYKKARKVFMKIRGEERMLARCVEKNFTNVNGVRLTKSDAKRIMANARRDIEKRVKSLMKELDDL